jgi:dATP pyrophosphohydrolase
MNHDYKRPESVLVVIYTRAGDVLLMERRQPEDYWQSVTGSLGRDEQPHEAALREVREETGLDVSDLLVDCEESVRFRILPAWRDRYAPEAEYNLEHLFLVELPEPVEITLNPDEHRQLRWFPARHAALKASSYTNQQAIERFVVFRG